MSKTGRSFFTTACSGYYALEGYEYNAIDYLRPITFKTFMRSEEVRASIPPPGNIAESPETRHMFASPADRRNLAYCGILLPVNCREYVCLFLLQTIGFLPEGVKERHQRSYSALKGNHVLNWRRTRSHQLRKMQRVFWVNVMAAINPLHFLVL